MDILSFIFVLCWVLVDMLPFRFLLSWVNVDMISLDEVVVHRWVLLYIINHVNALQASATGCNL